MNKKHLIASLLVVVFAMPLLFAHAVYAADAKWVDKATIVLGADTYIDGKPNDSSRDYYKDGKNDDVSCNPVIRDISSDNKTAKLHKRHSVLGGLGTTCADTGTETVTFAADSIAKATGAASASSESGDSCQSNGGALAWIMCPVIKALDAAINWLDTQIQALLEVDKSSYENPELYRAWSQIRNFAYIILIPIMLVMVLGTAMGSEMFSAYTVKKALPRMVAAILFIALSYSICTTLITFSNVVGGGTMGIMTQPFNHLVADKAGAGKTVGNTGLADLFGSGNSALSLVLAAPKAGAAIIGVILLIFFFWNVILLFVATAFFVLLLRQLFIVALLLVAPLAILAWIFPGNDKLWKGWWSGFSKLLIMFPLIIALLAVGRDMAWLISNDRGGGLQGSFIAPLAKLALYMMPYAFIPLTFKFAGGAFATLSGMAQDKGKGLSGVFKKGRQAKRARVASGNMFKGKRTGIRGAINSAATVGFNAHKGGWNPRTMRANYQSARDTAIEQEKEEMKKDHDAQSILPYDDLALAGRRSRNEAEATAELQRADETRRRNGYANFDRDTFRNQFRADNDRDATDDEVEEAATNAGLANMRYRNPNDLRRDVARIERLRKKYSPQAFRQVLAQQAVAGGTATEDAAEALQLITESYEGDDAGLMTAIAEFRKGAMAAGRVDQGGASQGVTFNVARELAAGNIDAAEANRRIHADVLRSQGANVLSHPSMKPSAIRQMLPDVIARLDTALASGNQQTIDFELANVANLQDSLAGSSPQLADQFAQQLMTRSIPVSTMSDDSRAAFSTAINQVVGRTPVEEVHVHDPDTNTTRVERTGGEAIYEARQGITALDAVNARRASGDFQAKRREYNTGAEQQAARAGGPPVDPGGPAVTTPTIPI